MNFQPPAWILLVTLIVIVTRVGHSFPTMFCLLDQQLWSSLHPRVYSRLLSTGIQLILGARKIVAHQSPFSMSSTSLRGASRWTSSPYLPFLLLQIDRHFDLCTLVHMLGLIVIMCLVALVLSILLRPLVAFLDLLKIFFHPDLFSRIASFCDYPCRIDPAQSRRTGGLVHVSVLLRSLSK